MNRSSSNLSKNVTILSLTLVVQNHYLYEASGFLEILILAKLILNECFDILDELALLLIAISVEKSFIELSVELSRHNPERVLYSIFTYSVIISKPLNWLYLE